MTVALLLLIAGVTPRLRRHATAAVAVGLAIRWTAAVTDCCVSRPAT